MTEMPIQQWPAGAGPAAEDWGRVGQLRAERLAAETGRPVPVPAMPDPALLQTAPAEVRAKVVAAGQARADVEAAEKTLDAAEVARAEADSRDFERQVAARLAGERDPGTPGRDRADTELARARRALQVAAEAARRARAEAVDSVAEHGDAYQAAIDNAWKGLLAGRRSKLLADLAAVDLQLDCLAAEEVFLRNPGSTPRQPTEPKTGGLIGQLRAAYNPNA